MGYSILIELAQLVSFQGMFELDDVIYNVNNLPVSEPVRVKTKSWKRLV